jgi:hypothetical protein
MKKNIAIIKSMFSRTLSRIPRQLYSITTIRAGSNYVRYNYNPLVECESHHVSRNLSTLADNKNAIVNTEEPIRRQNAFIFISAKLCAILGLFAMIGNQDINEVHEEIYKSL